MKTTNTHVYFWGDEDIYSNFYQPVSIELNGNVFTSSEQAFMYLKANHFGADDIAEKIINTKKPYDCKKLGRSIKNFNVDEWNKESYNCMKIAVYAKFNQDENLKKQLLETDNKIIVEASPYDKIWGVGLGENDPDVLDESKWKGLNLLGKVLMDIRNELRV